MLIAFIGADNFNSSDWWADWSWNLLVGGSALALVALVLGLAVDRRGPTIPLALLAILLAVLAFFLVGFLSIES